MPDEEALLGQLTVDDPLQVSVELRLQRPFGESAKGGEATGEYLVDIVLEMSSCVACDLWRCAFK